MNEVEDQVREKLKAQGLLGGRGITNAREVEEQDIIEKMESLGRRGELPAECARSGRPGIRERVGDQLRRAINDAQRGDRLAELNDLFNKHPDVARILDLMEDVRH